MKLYGVVTYDRAAREWRIACEPHVMLRLKRVFEKIAKGAHGEAGLSDSIENGRDLAWFLERFPMVIDAEAREVLDARVREHEALQEILTKVLDENYEPQAFELALPPRQYQAIAADLILKTGSLLLADELGLGKTACAIAAMTDLRTRPALVVTLTHLPRQWVAEIAKFAPGLTTHILRSTRPYELPPDTDVIVTSYSKLSGWADHLAGKIRFVVYDEAQELRTGDGTQKYDGAKYVSEQAAFCAGLTGTPIYNYGNEIYNVLDCIRPGALGTMHEFSREWCRDTRNKSARKEVVEPKAFGRYLRDAGLMLRRTRADVGRELPPLTIIPHEIDADLHPLREVKTTAVELARIILAETEIEKGRKMRAAEELSWKLRQATGVAKAAHAAAFVRMLVEGDEPVLLYGWHHLVYRVWGDLLEDLRPAFYTGEESVKQKEEARARFLDGDTRVLIMSLRAGAGLDGLQHACRTVVFGELDWSPGVHEQCAGRVFRDGQQDPVMAYFLVASVGSDPVIADVLGLKRRQSEGVCDPDAELVEQLTVDPEHMKRLARSYLEQVRA